jgi:tetratricopeptide (TPR) repeat protein
MITKTARNGIPLALLCLTVLLLPGCGGPAARQARYEKRGQEYLAADKLDKARVEFRNALQIAPNSSQLRYENGLVAERMENIREAATFYIGAIDANPGNTPARAHLGNLYVLAGMPDLALQQVKSGLTKHPDDATLLSVHAAALSLKRDYESALSEGQRAVELDPKSEDAIATLAAIQMAAGHPDKAAAVLAAAVALLPDSITLRRVSVQVCLNRKDIDCAERELLPLIRIRPHEIVFRMQLASLYAQANRLDDAERILRKAVADLPDVPQAKSNLVEFLWALRGHDAAEAELKRMIAQAPHEDELRFTLARFFERSNDPARAEAEYQNLIQQHGKGTVGVRARDALAAMYAAKNDMAGAEKLINQVLEENPGDYDALVLRAQQELARGQPESAIADLRRVLRDQPNSSEVLVALSHAYVADGEPQLAEDTARHAVESDPSNLVARVELARALIRTGKFDQGRTMLYAVDKQRPDDPTVVDLIYRSSIALNDQPAAQLAATELVKIRPNSGVGQIDLGILAEGAGRKEEALADYRKAFELQPRAAEPLKAIVLLLERSKRYDEAVAFLDEVTARNPQAALAPQIKGEVLLVQGSHLKQAEAAFRLALQRAPKWWSPYSGLAAVAIKREDLPAAAALLQDAAVHAQLGESERLELASLLINSGEAEKGMDQYELVLKANPKSPTAASALAMLLVTYRTDDVSLNRAAGLVRPFAGSNDWRLLDAFGWVHFKNQDVAIALPALQQASGQRPEVPQLRFHLGMAQLKAGQAVEAEKNLAAAVGPGTLFPGRDEAKAVLAQLRSRRAS